MNFANETEFNKWLRAHIRARGPQCLHVREADLPGPLDLVVWQRDRIVGWYELKLDDREVEPSQVTFMRELGSHSTPYAVIRYWNDTERFEVSTLADATTGKLITQFSTTSNKKLLDYILQ